MKLIYVITSFALVNFCVAELDNLTKEAIITNLHMDLTKAQLPEVMRNVSLKNIPLTILSLMCSTPENSIKSLVGSLASSSTGHNLMAIIQYDMQKAIKEVTNIDPPTIENEAAYENVTLEKLGEDRRKLTLEAVKNLINSTLDGKDPDFNKSFPGFRNLCSLLAMFKMIENPDSCVFSAKVEETRYPLSGEVEKKTCIIRSDKAPVIRYEYVNGILWQLNFEGVGSPFYSLSSQVQ
ncbi:uncharacterized protein LOC126838247 isoform X1 [Adelges cooleyi]|uniref:uncharacterized protein LOC126838247 isoform X1 n=1 Tax=Adelges cooleyi TaxID=133065 RepID=UPI00217FE1AC|nr:uncharacterized protein LOC126838247 isoform X1 [Adelges cooleyi]